MLEKKNNTTRVETTFRGTSGPKMNGRSSTCYGRHRHGTGFELSDMFLCCKFAEGDSRILQQKLTRDRLKRVAKEGPVAAVAAAVLPSRDRPEAMAALLLARKIAPVARDHQKLAVVMDENWREVYGLADIVADRHMADGARSAFMEPCVERLQPGSTKFDEDWKSKV